MGWHTADLNQNRVDIFFTLLPDGGPGLGLNNSPIKKKCIGRATNINQNLPEEPQT